VTLAAETPIADAIEVFVRGDHDSLPVIDQNGTLIGIVTATDLLKHRPR
jgi:CBS domain-containing protein